MGSLTWEAVSWHYSTGLSSLMEPTPPDPSQLEAPSIPFSYPFLSLLSRFQRKESLVPQDIPLPTLVTCKQLGPLSSIRKKGGSGPVLAATLSYPRAPPPY